MDKIEELLTRGVANIIPGKEELKKVLEAGKILNIYLGIDPTMTRIHLGHAVPLRKLQQFSELGHKVTFLIGDFTTLVGDTSDKESERPILTPEEIKFNFQTYKQQAEKIIDFNKIEIVHNSEWLGKLTFSEIIKLTQNFSMNDFISRELIKKRLTEGKRVRLDEVLYPIMQGYDSYIMDTDLQLGGTDQTFNMQAGRILQKNLRSKESFVMTNTFLSGTDGRKMSKTWNNAIWIDDTPENIFAKIMAIKDELIIEYLTLCTNFSVSEIKNIANGLENGRNPMEVKKLLAFNVINDIHDATLAENAKEHFEKTIQQKIVPLDLPLHHYSGQNQVEVADLLMLIKFSKSKAEAKRLIEQGGVEIDEERITNPNKIILIKNDMIIRVGKRRFARIATGN